MKRRTGWALLALTALVLLGLAWDPSSHAARQEQGQRQKQKRVLENIDSRKNGDKETQGKFEARRQRNAERFGDKHASVVKNLSLARAAFKDVTPGVEIEVDEQTQAPQVVRARGSQRLAKKARGRLSGESLVRDFLGRNARLYGLTTRQVEKLKKISEYKNPEGNLSWIDLKQELDGLPVFQAELRAAFDADGNLFQTVSTLVPGLNDDEESGRKGGAASMKALPEPTLSAAQAVAHGAASLGITVNPNELTVKEQDSDGHVVILNAGPFANDIKVELQYFPMKAGEVTLAWSMILYQDEPAYYTFVDAESGDLLWRKNLVNDQTQTATYVVYSSDSPAPLTPLPLSELLTATVPTIQGAAVPRTSFTLITQHPLFNDPWLNDGDNTTIGNNVDAGLDLVAPDGIEPATRPIGAPLRVFDFAYNPAPGSPPPGDAPTVANFRFGEVVNMFYWTNKFHDILYGLGFTEGARNFQLNNYGRGGVGNDRVLAQGQDFSNTNNANFLTPPDGTSGRMQMFIFTGPTPDRSSGLDQEILIHELTHGVSNRLHGNAAGLNFAQGGGMGEGWGDFFGRAILSDASEDINGIYGAGGWSTQLIVAGYQNNYYYGIRRFPYALKTTLGLNGKPHNPLTFADVDQSKINLTDGAFPRGPIGSATAAEVHNVGEVWCMVLLEVRARLIALHGFAVGNQRAMQLAIDGMKLEPADPTMLQARDAILAASAASGGGPLEEKAIWEGFASRGMGFGATVSAANSNPITVGESFDTPNLQIGDVNIVVESCPSAGHADPGESIELAVELTNPLSATATGVTAEIVGGGSASYGDIAGLGSATRNLSYTVPSSATCGETIALTININSSFGPVSKTYLLQIGAPTSMGPAVSYSTGNVAVPLPDVTTTDIPITVPDTGFVGDVNVRVRLNHTFDGDLVISLIAPDGTSVALANNRGGAGDNYGNGANDCSGTPTVFDDAAGTPISAGVAPFAGTFRPDQALSALNGKQMNGVWKLRVNDTANLDTGTLGCATIEIQPQLYFCCGVAGTPIISAAPPAVMVSESVAPANGAPDPDETVTMSFPLVNVGTGPTTNLVATLLPGGGVNAPSGPQNYGSFSPVDPAVSRDFTFVASGTCGGNITATFQLQDGAMNLGTVTFTIQIGATLVGNTVGSNATNIVIPGVGTGAATGAPANPYPSNINIAGVVGTVTKVTATLTGFSHTFPSDVDVLLVGPGGQKLLLMSDVGGGTDAVNANLVFDDTGPAIGATIVSGTFRPTNVGAGDLFPAPAPAGPYPATSLSIFNGVNPNGTWSLYVVDDAGVDVGSISGGWSLSITTAVPLCNAQACSIGVVNLTQANDPGLCGAIVNYPAPTIVGSCGVITYVPPSGSFFPVGVTNVLATGTSTIDNSTTDTSPFTVTVNDTEGPSVTDPIASPSSLWPPNHQMRNVTVSYSATDNCTSAGNITCIISSVTSNEPVNGTDDGDTAPDWQIVNNHLVRLRAERSGIGTGRIYTITVRCTDQYGNHTFKTVLVTVPLSQ